MRVRIDPSLCQGHGRCYDLAPDLFGEDDDGYATLTDLTADGRVPPGREDGARLAADNCPEAAVLVFEDTVFEDTVFEDTVFEDTVFEDTVFEDTVSEQEAVR